MELSSSQTFCAVLLSSASREAHATTNGDSIRENIFFIQFARTVRSCTNHATFRVDECDDDQRCAISAQYGDVYLASDDDVSLHRFIVVSWQKKRRKRRERSSEFHSAREAHQRRRRWKQRTQHQRTVHERPETTSHGHTLALVTRGILVATLNATKSDRGVRESQRKRRERAVLQTRHVCVFTRRVGTPLRQYVQLTRHRKRGRTDIRQNAHVRRVHSERNEREHHEL